MIAEVAVNFITYWVSGRNSSFCADELLDPLYDEDPEILALRHDLFDRNDDPYIEDAP